MTQRIEKIKCPYCGKVQDAVVEVPMEPYVPFADYTHQCEHCGEWITESVWERVEL